MGLSGAQGLFGVTPDLATYAKALGGGTVLSVLAGRQEFMDWIVTGKVVHAGTLNGNPLSLAAANATLDVLAENGGAVFRSDGASRASAEARTGGPSCGMPVIR